MEQLKLFKNRLKMGDADQTVSDMRGTQSPVLSRTGLQDLRDRWGGSRKPGRIRFLSILYRYLLFEMTIPFCISMIFFTFIFLMATISKVTNFVVNYDVGIIDILLLMLFSVPSFLVYVIPMAVMMAVLLAFLRLSGDREIVALKAVGVSIYSFLPPVLVFCLAGWLLASGMTLYGVPRGVAAIRSMTIKLAAENLDIALRARTFNDKFEGVMVYINEINMQKEELVDVFIEDQRTPNLVTTVVASKGKLFMEKEAMAARLRLYDGTINQVDINKRSVNLIQFDHYDMKLDMKERVSKMKLKQKKRREMTLSELIAYAEKGAASKDSSYYNTLIQIHMKFSLPFACFALGILAIPLGLTPGPSTKSYGIGISLVCFILYYLLLTIGQVFGEMGIYPPIVGMWLPAFVMGSLGIYLLVRAANERRFQFDWAAVLWETVIDAGRKLRRSKKTSWMRKPRKKT